MDVTSQPNDPQKLNPDTHRPRPPQRKSPPDPNEALADAVDAAADEPRSARSDNGGSVGESVVLETASEDSGHSPDLNKTPVPRAGEGYGEVSGDAFAKLSKAELYAQAKALSIPNRSNMTKVQLITAIRDALNRTSS